MCKPVGEPRDSAASTSPSNSSASARRPSPPRSAGWGKPPGRARGARGPHPQPALGRPAWRPLSGALDKHEIITWGATGAAAATVFRSGTRVPQAGPGLGTHARPVPLSSSSRGRAEGGARGGTRSQNPARDEGEPEMRGGEDPSGDRGHGPESDPSSAASTPSRDAAAPSLGGKSLGVQRGTEWG